MVRNFLLSLLVTFISFDAAAQTTRRLTMGDIYDPKLKVAFGGNPQTGFVWLNDRELIWPRTDGTGKLTEHSVFDVVDGKTRRWFDRNLLKTRLLAAGIAEADASRASEQKTLTLNAGKTSLLLTLSKDIFVYSLNDATLRRLTKNESPEDEASFSPDGKRIAFVREGNLYTLDLASGRETPLTSDGSSNILNGILDWVYQEEIYGRGNFRAYWWSPDSSRLAFLRLDETQVPEFKIVDHLPLHQEVETMRYPKAGDPNPLVQLHVVSADAASRRVLDLSDYSKDEPLIVSVAWKPDSSKVFFQVQNRVQTWLELVQADWKSGATNVLFREQTRAWIEPSGDPLWLRDGSFLWLSERSGFKHLYHYTAAGKQLAQLTDGKWEVRKLHGVDPANKIVYFSGTQRSVLGPDIYSLALANRRISRLSRDEGTHDANFNESFSYFVDSSSNITTPARVTLHARDGKQLRVIDANAVPLLNDYRFIKPEFVQVKTRDGFITEALLIKPAGFDPSKKYPVFQHTYSGPHAQQVRNAWLGSNMMFHQLLAQHGAVVWIHDNRTASGKGAESAWPVYKKFGELELRDLEDGVNWLKQQSWVDGERIMLSGWSYGGFMTSYALTHSKTWKAGIAGGSVTDWRDYDSIYTERYMGLPKDNEDAYKKTSPRNDAATLHGNLLLLHGTIDDNVHLQNTIQFANDLQEAGKPFQMMLYPRSRHAVTDPELVRHMRMTMYNFIDANLELAD